MRKWAWRILVGASLLLLVGTSAMWVRAQWAWERVRSTVWIGAGQRAVHHAAVAEGFRATLRLSLDSGTIDLSDPGGASRYRRDATAPGRLARDTFPPRSLDPDPDRFVHSHSGGYRWGFGWERLEYLPPEAAPVTIRLEGNPISFIRLVPMSSPSPGGSSPSSSPSPHSAPSRLGESPAAARPKSAPPAATTCAPPLTPPAPASRPAPSAATPQMPNLIDGFLTYR